MKALWIIPLATATLVLPLHLWRTFYPASDWALLFLVFLAVALFVGIFPLATSLYQTKLNIAVRSTSPFSKFLTGRVHAGFVALIFSAAALPVLAWLALTASPVEVVGLVALSAAAGSSSLGIRAWLRSHLTSLFARSAGIKIGTVAAAIVFVPLLAWINWNYATHPGEIRTASLSQAVTFAINELPARRGWIAEVLSVFYAMDAAKLWVLVQPSIPPWATILFSLDSALVSFVVASAGAILTNSVSYMIEGTDQ